MASVQFRRTSMPLDVVAQRGSVVSGSPARRSGWAHRCFALVASAAVVALAGCGVGVQDLASPTEIAGRVITGHVHGGVFPIQNATIRLMQTLSNGYGGAAKQLVPSTTSDSTGYFTFPDTGWTCTSGQFAYITVTGGHSSNLTGSAANNSVVQVGVIGPCSDLATTSEIDNVNVFISEASTVAAASALGNFITIDSTKGAGKQIVNISAPANNNVSSPLCSGTGTAMTCTAAGLAHAFTNAYTLVDSVRYDGSFPGGQARATNPVNSASQLPQQLVNTLANILQNCVDSLSTSSYCTTLFGYATPPNGTAPANTLQAAMNMAKNPTTNIANLYSLQSRTAYFTPDLDAAPTTLALSIFYGISGTSTSFPYPVDIAVDAADDAFVLYGSAAPSLLTVTGVAVLSPAGAVLGQASAHYGYPSQIAVDIFGNAYVSNDDLLTGAVLRVSYASPFTKVATLANASGLALDASNNIWVSADSKYAASFNEYTYAAMAASKGAATPTYSSNAIGVAVSGLAIDPDEDIWGVSNPASGNATAVLLNNNSGDVDAPTYSGNGYVTKSLGNANGYSIAPSTGSTTTASAYFPVGGELDYLTITAPNGNLLLTPGVAKTVSGSNQPHRSQVDGAGNVFWTDLESTGLLYMYTPTSNPNSTTGSYISLLPCYAINDGSGYSCVTLSSGELSNLRGVALDSAGDVWYGADAGYGVIIETLGLAAPTWPQLSYTHPGSQPQ